MRRAEAHHHPSIAAIAACASLALFACQRDALAPGGSLDLGGGASQDLQPAPDLSSPAPPDMASFCGDPNSPRIELNGMLATSPAVSAKPLFLNCCDAAAIDFVSMQIATPISLVWRHQAGQAPNPPATFDLAKLPPGWSVMVYSGCNPTESNCKPTDSFTMGYTGTLTVAGNPGGYQTSACLHVAEDAANPHPVIHDLRLWTPTISTN